MPVTLISINMVKEIKLVNLRMTVKDKLQIQ